MALWGFLAGAPLALFLMIVLLPRGRPALVGCAVTGLVLGLLWAGYFFDISGLRASPMGSRGHLMIGLVALSAAWAVAGSLQGLRLRLPGNWPGWVWPATVIFTLVAVVLAVLRMLGF